MAKLYTTKGNVNGFKAMVAALYNGVPLQVPDNFTVEAHASTAEYLALSPMGEVPCLETACGAAISQPDAILRFVMRSNLASQLYGEANPAPALSRRFLNGSVQVAAPSSKVRLTNSLSSPRPSWRHHSTPGHTQSMASQNTTTRSSSRQ